MSENEQHHYMAKTEMGGYGVSVGASEGYFQVFKRIALLGEAFRRFEVGMGMEQDIELLNEFSRNYKLGFHFIPYKE